MSREAALRSIAAAFCEPPYPRSAAELLDRIPAAEQQAALDLLGPDPARFFPDPDAQDRAFERALHRALGDPATPAAADLSEAAREPMGSQQAALHMTLPQWLQLRAWAAAEAAAATSVRKDLP